MGTLGTPARVKDEFNGGSGFVEAKDDSVWLDMEEEEPEWGGEEKEDGSRDSVVEIGCGGVG